MVLGTGADSEARAADVRPPPRGARPGAPTPASPSRDSAQAAQGAFRSLDIGHPKPMSQVLLREALQVQAARPKRGRQEPSAVVIDLEPDATAGVAAGHAAKRPVRATEPIVIDLEPKVTIARYNLVFKVVEAFLQLDGERRDECEVPELHIRVNCKLGSHERCRVACNLGRA
jgi:hypothetical protein